MWSRAVILAASKSRQLWLRKETWSRPGNIDAMGHKLPFLYLRRAGRDHIQRNYIGTIPRLVCLMETAKGGSQYENSDYWDR